MNKVITIYTDGSSLGNPGPGGWGAVLMFGNKRKEMSSGYKYTTNNRMELMAAIEALKALKRSDLKIRLHTDSKYIADAINKGWLESWQKKNWKRKTGPVLNSDLWKQFAELITKFDVDFIWVPAHTGIKENERCDELAKEAAESENLLEDIGYLKETG